MPVEPPGGGEPTGAGFGDGDAGDLIGDLTRWLAEQRADAAAAARAREYWLRQAAAEEAVVAGVLLDLAEREAVVVAQGVAGRHHRGTIRGVGEDFFVMRTGTRSDVLLRYEAVLSVRSEGRPIGGGGRAATLDLTLAEALTALAPDRPRVLVVARDGAGLSGELRAAGRDVLTIRLADAGTVYVPVAALAEVSLVDP